MKLLLKDIQLKRFCLYGFLKNQMYFDPFLILAFREKGFSFAEIGILVSFRSISINLLEMPSGAVADVYGRRRSMIVSMLGYILSFVVFALAKNYWLFFPAMFAFSIGTAFRTGTHKAMIFHWLAFQGRADDKTRVYGLTRSWSKMGSMLNAIVATILVIATGGYVWIFWVSIVPYVLNIINLSFYPKYLDNVSDEKFESVKIWQTLKDGLKLSVSGVRLRSLILENVCFEGFYSTAREYLQPLLKAVVLTTPLLYFLPVKSRTAILIGSVYVVLYLLGSVASRNTHKLVGYFWGKYQLVKRIWILTLIAYILVTIGVSLGVGIVPVLGFVAMGIVLNIWKPVFVSRFCEASESQSAATTLSVANQSKTLSVAVLAPLLGLAVDKASLYTTAVSALLPVAVCGVVFSVLGYGLHLKQKQ